MSIRNPAKYWAQHWDWGFLVAAGCFADTKIEPSDIDGIVERRGHYLKLEGKSEDKQIDLGQRLMIDTDIARHDVVIVVNGNPGGIVNPIVKCPKCDFLLNAFQIALPKKLPLIREIWVYSEPDRSRHFNVANTALENLTPLLVEIIKLWFLYANQRQGALPAFTLPETYKLLLRIPRTNAAAA